MRDALDGISEYDPHVLVDLDLDPTSYTGNARFSQGFFDTAAALGHPVVWMIQETYSERSQLGYTAGVYDCQFAELRARERGWSGPIAYVVSDGNGMDRWDASEYGRGVGDAASVPFRVGPGYGANGVIDSFIRGVLASNGAHLLLLGTDGQGARWVPETWPGGNNAVGQVVGYSPVPDTDLNHVTIDVGAPAPAPQPAPARAPEDNMELVITPVYPFTGGHLARLALGDGFKLHDFTSTGPADEIYGCPKAAADMLGPNLGGVTRRDLIDPTLAAGYIARSDAVTAAALGGGAPTIDLDALATAVATHLQGTGSIDYDALGRAVAQHMKVTVTAA